ncbi:23S rRNA (pseudouridine(1915)-N(3))-methyltransferase RlmH [Devosia sp. XJ19-1]|uniref:Ribosomal RNA large subunit methyltransferase H n=1 Tax=Devosia ureilytica TaxID=2952754 RepID=A0A9Q4ANN0_9HYPH|nr:23S rRNA (pseudouridine(1915)-N(3))-methyltransferase RlmH [Devosia ureilytica]MCP8882754.1 23S rRNA (pseudouridine(1915)-N(3))-methyltransferase RlmH [Devosia ureilytica]MCP8886878.1 23S rRNA (pseudouridine(1915)-N(3))-methyltransferase RlmH [Devosia ureilytica]
MRISIAAIGRMKNGPERELVARYLERASASGKPLALTGFDVTEINESRAGSAAARKVDEAKALRAALPEGVIVMLDERGKGLNSEIFATQIARWRDDGRPGVGFVIGGADGIDPDFVRAADLVVSFSPMVWPHQLVRIMLAEQLYRTTTILSGHPYHRGD